jgi:hypothetical protein
MVANARAAVPSPAGSAGTSSNHPRDRPPARKKPERAGADRGLQSRLNSGVLRGIALGTSQGFVNRSAGVDFSETLRRRVKLVSARRGETGRVCGRRRALGGHYRSRTYVLARSSPLRAALSVPSTEARRLFVGSRSVPLSLSLFPLPWKSAVRSCLNSSAHYISAGRGFACAEALSSLPG